MALAITEILPTFTSVKRKVNSKNGTCSALDLDMAFVNKPALSLKDALAHWSDRFPDLCQVHNENFTPSHPVADRAVHSLLW